MTFCVLVIDRDAGWAVENLGPFETRAEAEVRARVERLLLGNLEPVLGSLSSVGSAAEVFEVRVVEVAGEANAA